MKEAQEARRRHFDSIGRRWFEYLCGLQPGQLDRARREMADAAVALEHAVKTVP
jgi:hypothetical protein